MEAQQLVGDLHHHVSPQNVFGPPVQVDGATVLPAISFRSGAGARGGERGGAGYGVRARPVGIFILKGGEVTWRPAIDVNRILWRGQMIGFVVLMTRVLGPMLSAASARRSRQRGPLGALMRWAH